MDTTLPPNPYPYTNHPTSLAAKVHCVNKANQFLRDKVPAILAALRLFVGEKMYTTAGSKTVKFQKILPEAISNATVHAYYDCTTYSLWYKVCYHAGVTGKSGGPSVDVSYLLADIQNNVITKVYDETELENRRVDYTEEYVIQARAELKAAQALVSKANGKLFHFGEWDR
jgi:hypothetical protein